MINCTVIMLAMFGCAASLIGFALWFDMFTGIAITYAKPSVAGQATPTIGPVCPPGYGLAQQ